MKTKLMLMLALLLNVLLGQQAQAFYNPSTGRWLSRDPIGENGGENLYAVWKNDYINKFDLFGLCPCSLASAAAAGNPAGNAKDLCQQTIDGVKKDGGPRELPKSDECKPCQKLIDDLLNSPNFVVKDLLSQFGKSCPRPPVRCAECGGAGGWYDSSNPEIVICVKHSVGVGTYEYSQTLAHELTHALQRCNNKDGKGCRDSLKREMEAYYCGREDIAFGDLYSDAVRSSCGTDPSKCTPDEVQNLYQEMQEWFNKEKDNFCKFPRKPDYPGPSLR